MEGLRIGNSEPGHLEHLRLKPRGVHETGSCVDGPGPASGEMALTVISVGCSHVSGLFDAAHMAAGPDAIRGPGPSQLRALEALPGFRVVPILGHDRCPISPFHPRDLSERGVACQAIAGARVLYVSPRAISAQAIRAILLATARETSRKGRRSSSDRIQAEWPSALPVRRRITAVAPMVSRRRK